MHQLLEQDRAFEPVQPAKLIEQRDIPFRPVQFCQQPGREILHQLRAVHKRFDIHAWFAMDAKPDLDLIVGNSALLRNARHRAGIAGDPRLKMLSFR